MLWVFTNRRDLIGPHAERLRLGFASVPEEADVAVIWIPRSAGDPASATAAARKQVPGHVPLYVVVEGGSSAEEAAGIFAAGATPVSAALLPLVLGRVAREKAREEAVRQENAESRPGEHGEVAVAPPGAVLPNLVAVFSPATHVGKTFLSLCLAVCLARRGIRTVLVDLDCDKVDLWWASGMARRGIPPKATVGNWSDLACDPASFIDEHPQVPGLFVLPGGNAGRLPRATEVLPLLSSRFGAVVADLAPVPSLPHVVWTLRSAVRVVLVSDLSPKAVVQVSDAIPRLAGVLPRERTVLVLNRTRPGLLGLAPKRFARSLGFDRFYLVPEVREAGKALRRGALPRFPAPVERVVEKAVWDVFNLESRERGVGGRCGFLPRLTTARPRES
ncbi:CpsD/CapB family tyrosine-protein kinase [Ammonifex thiophilus]|uniref:CpsD/CapB family tyrosine-protein kinase n=1 Tax=Ammonifex thiophilus TaxID=444093 RepID=UPI0014042431|nr:CpsD/CapB family tyrosine-protein kinase [Ammonifex thiophilus]